jgi:hypothetical protein
MQITNHAMLIRSVHPIFRCIRVLLVLGTVLLVMPAAGSGQGQGYRAPRTADGRPDLNGFWQALNTAHWDLEDHAAAPGPVLELGAAYAVPPGRGVVQGGPIPYRPDALAKKKGYAANALKEDAEIKCYLPGVPRMMYMPYPVQIVQSTDDILMLSEFATAQRTIYINGKELAPADTWMGWSNGRWDGETLVIDSTGFMGSTIRGFDEAGAIQVRFLDRAGNYHTDGLHVVERIRRTGPDHLLYEATIEDPNVYTRPWTISMPLYRRIEPNMELGEFKCEEFAGDLIFNRYAKEPVAR